MLYLDIDRQAVLHNIDTIRKHVHSELNAVIKANCYGHGIELAAFIEPYVDSFSVSSIAEVLDARGVGIKKKIYMLGSINVRDFLPLDGIVYTVCSHEDIDFLCALGYNFEVALKLNSGMNRLGASKTQFATLVERIKKTKALHLDSVYTHFFDCGGGSHVSQFEIFDSLTCGLDVKRHCCASNCLALPPKYHLDMVRCGLAVYGYGQEFLRPSLKAFSTISQINDVCVGEYVGYGSYIQKKDSRIAIIRAGYADGYRRIKTNQFASAEGKLLPIVGQISMDMTAVDISGTSLKKDDQIFLINELATAQDLATANETIVYEVLTAFNCRRVQRNYS